LRSDPRLLLLTTLIVVISAVQFPAPAFSQEPGLIYHMSISMSDAASGLAHVKMSSSSFSNLATITLAMYDNTAWWYDLRTAPNGEWNNEMALDATYAVGDVAEIAIPLEMMGNPTRIDMLVWIYYPSLQITVDQTGWGTAEFVTSNITLTTTEESEMTASTATTMAEFRLATSAATSPTITAKPTTQTGWVQPSWEYLIIAVVVIGIALGLVVRKSRRKQ
jgi:hypothetical protein